MGGVRGASNCDAILIAISVLSARLDEVTLCILLDPAKCLVLKNLKKLTLYTVGDRDFGGVRFEERSVVTPF